jgi:hypothetical protein
MNDILRDFLHKFVTAYPDDVCVFSRTVDGHMEHMRMVLQRFKAEGLKLRLKKCFSAFKRWSILAILRQLVHFCFDKESRSRCRLANSYDAKGGSQFRAILQLLRQIYSSL